MHSVFMYFYQYSSPSSKWVPGGNTGEIKAARKGTGHSASQSRWLSTSVSLTGTPQRTDRIWDIPLPVQLPFYESAQSHEK